MKASSNVAVKGGKITASVQSIGSASVETDKGGFNSDPAFWFDPNHLDYWLTDFQHGLKWIYNEWVPKGDKDKNSQNKAGKNGTLKRYDVYNLEPGDLRILSTGRGVEMRYLDTLPKEERQTRLKNKLEITPYLKYSTYKKSDTQEIKEKGYVFENPTTTGRFDSSQENQSNIPKPNTI